MAYKYAMSIPEHHSIGSIVRLATGVQSMYLGYNATSLGSLGIEQPTRPVGPNNSTQSDRSLFQQQVQTSGLFNDFEKRAFLSFGGVLDGDCGGGGSGGGDDVEVGNANKLSPSTPARSTSTNDTPHNAFQSPSSHPLPIHIDTDLALIRNYVIRDIRPSDLIFYLDVQNR